MDSKSASISCSHASICISKYRYAGVSHTTYTPESSFDTKAQHINSDVSVSSICEDETLTVVNESWK